MRTLCSAAALTLAAAAAAAAPRAALVVGNETYLEGQPVPGAVEAASQAADRLARAGYEVVFAPDVDVSELREAVGEFEDHVRDAEIALVVYIGRAVAFGGATWLLGLDARSDRITEIGAGAVPLALPLGVAARAEAAAALVDGAWPARFDGLPGLGAGAFHEHPGVAAGVAGPGADHPLIISATAPRAEPPLRNPGEAPFVLNALDALLKETAAASEIASLAETALPGVYVAGTKPVGEAPVAVPASPDLEAELAFWAEAAARGGAEDYAEYLRRFPHGLYVHAARSRLKEIEAGENADFGFAAAAEDALQLSEAQRRDVQTALAALGHDLGERDGLFGPQTRAAIRAWQRTEGIEPTGFLTREGARLLLAGAADR